MTFAKILSTFVSGETFLHLAARNFEGKRNIAITYITVEDRHLPNKNKRCHWISFFADSKHEETRGRANPGRSWRPKWKLESAMFGRREHDRGKVGLSSIRASRFNERGWKGEARAGMMGARTSTTLGRGASKPPLVPGIIPRINWIVGRTWKLNSTAARVVGRGEREVGCK